jgi:hypothetical protein
MPVEYSDNFLDVSFIMSDVSWFLEQMTVTPIYVKVQSAANPLLEITTR